MLNVVNVLGDTLSVTDYNDNGVPCTQTYEHDQYQALRRLTDCQNNVVEMDYDVRGNKVAMRDPDMGNWSYVYDALGQLRSQTDAKGVSNTLTYDVLGRMKTRSEPEGTTVWGYDQRWKGAADFVSAPNSDGYRSDTYYDSLGRVIQARLQHSGKNFSTHTEYDAQSRPFRITYPSGLKVTNRYNANFGYLEEVDGSNGSGQPYWQIDDDHFDALGNITREVYGNGVVTNRSYDQVRGYLNTVTAGKNDDIDVQSLGFQWDSVGNLEVRTNFNANMEERFFYDSKNRLAYSELDDVENLRVTYDEVGNILSKSNLGTYDYDGDESPTRPHAVKSVTKLDGTVVYYEYDANGNMVNGDGREIEWTSYNKPKYIRQAKQRPAGDGLQPTSNPTNGYNQQYSPAADADGNFKLWWSEAQVPQLAGEDCDLNGDDSVEFTRPAEADSTQNRIYAPSRDLDGRFTVHWSPASERPTSWPSFCHNDIYSVATSNPTTGYNKQYTPEQVSHTEVPVYWSAAAPLNLEPGECRWNEYAQPASNPNGAANQLHVPAADVDGDFTVYWSGGSASPANWPSSCGANGENCSAQLSGYRLAHQLSGQPTWETLYEGSARQKEVRVREDFKLIPILQPILTFIKAPYAQGGVGQHNFRAQAKYTLTNSQTGTVTTHYGSYFNASGTNSGVTNVEGYPSCTATFSSYDVYQASNPNFSGAQRIYNGTNREVVANPPVGDVYHRIRARYSVVNSQGVTDTKYSNYFSGNQHTVVENFPQCEATLVDYRLNVDDEIDGTSSYTTTALNQAVQVYASSSYGGSAQLSLQARYQITKPQTGESSLHFGAEFAGNNVTLTGNSYASCTAELNGLVVEASTTPGFESTTTVGSFGVEEGSFNVQNASVGDHYYRVRPDITVTNSAGETEQRLGEAFGGRQHVNVGGSAAGTTFGESTFSYGPSRARYKHQISKTVNGASKQKTVYYVGGGYEEVVENGETKNRHFIQAGGKVIAVYTTKPQIENGYTYNIGVSTHYLHRDHLDSVDTITNHGGTVIERNSFDAFGKRRFLDWQPDTMGTLLYDSESRIRRGFTGHEQLDHVALVHMNGRVYDPTLGRFLSADPNVQFAESTQGLNRYTYVNNNPLSYNDPSGFFLKKLFKKLQNITKYLTGYEALKRSATLRMGAQIFGAVVNLIPGIGTIVSILINVAIAALNTYLVTGDIGASLQAGAFTALSAGASFGVGQAFGAAGGFLNEVGRAVAHGAAQGGLAAAQGGNFKAAFLAGAVGSAGGSAMGNSGLDIKSGAGKVVAGAVVGGTASKLGGGKFGNGAVTGAFVQALNHRVHGSRENAAKKRHYARNAENDEFAKDYDLYERNDLTLDKVRGAGPYGMKQATEGETAYHRLGAGNEGNLKFTSKVAVKESFLQRTFSNRYGKYEVILRPNGDNTYTHVNDPINMGTLNRGNNPFTHVIRDVIPYKRWGNSE